MSRLVVRCFSMSVDGFGAGPEQSLADPLGKGGMALHDWMFKTRTFQAMHGTGIGVAEGVDEGFATEGFRNIGAWVLGRNMFGPVRGPWPDDSWQGWWGDVPPYHCPVFVLTIMPDRTSRFRTRPSTSSPTGWRPPLHARKPQPEAGTCALAAVSPPCARPSGAATSTRRISPSRRCFWAGARRSSQASTCPPWGMG
jgi:dihydrofolate reductase